MSYFYCKVHGNGKPIGKGGSKNTGIHSHVATYEDGIKVEASLENGENVYRIYTTKGSVNPEKKLLVTIIKDNIIDGNKDR